jgi:hypothetical protein
MWVIFRDPKSQFNDLDKYTIDVVEDKDILTYQGMLDKLLGGRTFELNTNVCFVQQFFTTHDDVEYFARRYNTWIASRS